MKKVLIVGVNPEARSWGAEIYEQIAAAIPDRTVVVVVGVQGMIEVAVNDTPGAD